MKRGPYTRRVISVPGDSIGRGAAHRATPTHPAPQTGVTRLATPAASQGMPARPGAAPGSELTRSTQQPGSSLGGLKARSPSYRFRYAGALEPSSSGRPVGAQSTAIHVTKGRPVPPLGEKRADGAGKVTASSLGQAPVARSQEMRMAATGIGTQGYRNHGAEVKKPQSLSQPLGGQGHFPPASSPATARQQADRSNRVPGAQHLPPPRQELANPKRIVPGAAYKNDVSQARPGHKQRYLPGQGKIPANIAPNSLVK